MKIVCISDTHNHHDQIQVPDGDMVVFTGDWSVWGLEKELLYFSYWFKNLPHKYKVVIPGNHDRYAEKNYTLTKMMFGEDIHYLDNQGIIIEDKVIWGSPWTPSFGTGWAYNADRGEEIRKQWNKIPDDVNILLTHGPAHNILDTTWAFGEDYMIHVGCEELAKKLNDLKQVQLHVFGHIHSGYGISSKGPYGISVNASVTDTTMEGYTVKRLPLVVEL